MKYMKKLSISSLITVFVVSICFSQIKQGQHIGENKMLDVEIEFYNFYGKTITNAEGTFYHIWGWVFKEDKVYPAKYWGEYPLYFFGLPTNVLVKITNKGPRTKAKLEIRIESYVLKTDGSNGASLMEPKVLEVEVEKGETKVIDASFTTEWTPQADSGLDRFIVKVSHINEGGGPGNPLPALILQKEGVYCPPKFKKE